MKMLILFELRKILSRRLTLVTLVGMVLFSALLSVSTCQNKYAFAPDGSQGSGKRAVEIDKEIAAQYEGILTDEKVQQMMDDFAPTSDLHGLNAAYLYQNATQSAAFARFSDQNGNWNGLSVRDVFGQEQIKIGYVDGWLSTSRNMVRTFVVLAIAVILMLAPVFSGEYEGVDNLILTSRYGKTRCPIAKAAARLADKEASLKELSERLGITTFAPASIPCTVPSGVRVARAVVAGIRASGNMSLKTEIRFNVSPSLLSSRSVLSRSLSVVSCSPVSLFMIFLSSPDGGTVSVWEYQPENGVSRCGMNGPMPIISGCSSSIYRMSSMMSPTVWYGLPTMMPVPVW